MPQVHLSILFLSLGRRACRHICIPGTWRHTCRQRTQSRIPRPCTWFSAAVPYGCWWMIHGGKSMHLELVDIHIYIYILCILVVTVVITYTVFSRKTHWHAPQSSAVCIEPCCTMNMSATKPSDISHYNMQEIQEVSVISVLETLSHEKKHVPLNTFVSIPYENRWVLSTCTHHKI